MAEAIAAFGILASIAQLADYGFKLSIKLYTFSTTISTASRTIQSISNDVSLTSTVLKELCQIIKSDDAHLVSENALLATKQTVDECLKIFGELDDALSKCLIGMGKEDEEEKGAGKLKKRVGRGKVVVERLKWPFKQPKMELLRSNLDRLKASLTLMLQVLSYARDVSNGKQAESSFKYQKQIIESLARSERAMKRRYYALQHGIEHQTSEGTFNATINTSVNLAASRGINDEPSVYQHPPPTTKSPNPVGELLLCFKLLSELLENLSAAVKDENLADANPEVFQEVLDIVQTMELHELEKQYVDQPNHVKIEAIKNIQLRLRGFVNSSRGGVFVELGPDTKEEDIEVIKRQTGFPLDGDISSARNALRAVEPGGLAAKPSSCTSPILGVTTKEKPPRYEDRSDDEATLSPIIASPGTAIAKPRRSDSLQAQIDETIDVMRENINKVTQRGERLDSLQDSRSGHKVAQPENAISEPKTSDPLQAKTDEIITIMRKNIERVTERGQHRLMYGTDPDDHKLSEQAKRFYLEAKRRQNEGLLTKAYRVVVGGIAHVGSESYKSIQGLYEAGSIFFAEHEGDEEGETAKNYSQHETVLEGFEELKEEEEGDKNIVDDLLSQWTTLKVNLHDDHIERAVSSSNGQP